MDVIEIVKRKLPNTTLGDDVIILNIEEIEHSIKVYCNRTDVPADLKFTVANMVVDFINSEEKKTSEDNKQVKSIKEGDVQVTFEGSNSTLGEMAVDKIVHDYASQLNKYRKLRW